MDAGCRLSVEIVLSMLEERLHHPDADNGFILDGYPRNLAQANALDALLARLEQPMDVAVQIDVRSEEHTSELQSLMRISYAVFCLKKKNINKFYHNQ